MTDRRLRARLLRALAVVAVAASFLVGCTGTDTGGSIDGGGSGTAPLRPGATYAPTSTLRPSP